VPTFVVARDPDALPTAKLTERDLQCVLVRMKCLADDMQSLQDNVASSKFEISTKMDKYFDAAN